MTGLESGIRELVIQLVRSDPEIRREIAAIIGEADEFLSVAAAAKLADVAPGTVRRWIREGRLAGHRAGRQRRVKRSDLEQLMASGPDRPLSPEERALRDFG